MSAIISCPRCTSLNVRSLDIWSRFHLLVDYFHCKNCRHIWTTPKPGAPGKQGDITISKARAS